MYWSRSPQGWCPSSASTRTTPSAAFWARSPTSSTRSSGCSAARWAPRFGVVIGVTKDAIGWIGATFGPGATLGLVGGVLVFAVSAALGIGVGAAALVGVVAAAVICVATELTTDTRPLEPAERALAQQVFGDTLPLDDILLTSFGGTGGRGFTARGIDGKIYVNLGKNFSSPLGVSLHYPYPGQLLIHELTHAWQINNGSFLPALMCSMLVTQADNTFIDNEYAYGPPGPPWGGLNPEQQATIVDQWYAGNGLSDGWASMDQQNIYYRYVWDDVLQHAPALTAPTTLRTSSDSRLTTNTRRSVEPPLASSPGSRPNVTEHEDVFWVADDGALVRQGLSDDSGQLWSSNPPAALSAAGLSSPDGPVVVVSRSPATVDAFRLDPSGAVVTAGWSGQVAPPTTHSFTPICPAGSARPGSPLVALSRTPHNLDVFWVGTDGAITTAWWDQDVTGEWTDHPPFGVTGPAVVQARPPGWPRSAAWPVHIDLFWVGGDGSIQTQWWDGGGPPGGWAEHRPFAISGPGVARLGSPVVAVSRFPEQIDVFWIGRDEIGHDAVVACAGAGTGWADHGPFPVAPAGSAGPGSGLTAVARTQAHLDVFWGRARQRGDDSSGGTVRPRLAALGRAHAVRGHRGPGRLRTPAHR